MPHSESRIHVRIRELSKRFGGFTALDRITLDIAEGELVCFLGPSGCGKTTLLRAIGGLELQDEGTVEIGGRDVSFAQPAERDFGIVFQSYALFPNLTIRDNVAYGLVNRRQARDAIAARVRELLELVGLPEQEAKYPAQLSGGQQQRVALARALATGPSLLLLDEPLSALDAQVRVRLRGEIKALQRRLGVTTIMVTHDQEEALAMANRIVVMNRGRIEQVGTPDEVYAQPASAFVADFIGTMTFLDASVVGDHTVDASGLRLAVSLPLGARACRIGIRPESIELVTDAAGNGALSNVVDTKVAAVEFLGSFSRLTLTPDAAPNLALVADFSSREMARLVPSVSSPLRIRIAPEAMIVYAAGPGASG